MKFCIFIITGSNQNTTKYGRTVDTNERKFKPNSHSELVIHILLIKICLN